MNEDPDKRLPLKSMSFVVPSLSLVVFALLVTLPWGLAPDVTYVPPLLVLALIYCWTVRRPNLMPALLVFVTGVAVDVVTASPIGFWSFLFLVGYAAALRAATITVFWPTVTMTLTYPAVALFVGALAWGMASTYFGRLMGWIPVAESLKIAVVICPFIALATRSLERLMTAFPKSVHPVEAA